MALASLDDVKRVLRLTDADTNRDAQLRGALDAVESWAERRLWNTSRAGSQVETYHDVFEDAALTLPAADVVVTKVKVYEYPGSVGAPLSPVSLAHGTGYDVTADGRLLLRADLTVTPFEGAVAQRPLRCYARVEVFYEGTGVVPRALTEGIAFLAAGYWQDGPRALTGLTGERIGDYSYTAAGNTAGDEEPDFVARALFFLEDFLRHGRVAVT